MTIESLEGRTLLSVSTVDTSAALAPPPEVMVGPADPPRPAVTITAKSLVRGGARYTFKATFHFAEPIAPDTRAVDSIEVFGPPGVAQAEPGMLKVSRDGMRATAKFHVAAPGGRFDAADNGVYAIAWAGTVTRVAAASPNQPPVQAAAGQPGPLATFTVAARIPRGGQVGHAGSGGTTVQAGGSRHVGYVMTGPASATAAYAASGDTDLNQPVNTDDILNILMAGQLEQGVPVNGQEGFKLVYDPVTGNISIDTTGIQVNGFNLQDVVPNGIDVSAGADNPAAPTGGPSTTSTDVKVAWATVSTPFTGVVDLSSITTSD